MIWQPPLHPSAVVLGVFAAVVACAAMIALMRSATRPRRAALIVLRSVALVAVGVVLLDPRIASPEAAESPEPTLHVLIDTSPSMAVAGVDGDTRLSAARDWLQNLPPEELPAKIAWHQFDTDAQPTDSPPTSVDRDADATRLFHAVRSMIDGAAAGDALLVISDGHDTTGSPDDAVARAAAARGVPIFAVPVGAGDGRRVLVTASPDRAFTGEPVTLRWFTAGFGDDAMVTIRRVDVTVYQALLDQGDAWVVAPFDDDSPPDAAASYNVTIADATGQAADGVTVRHLGRRIRVLLVEGEPNWNSRFVADALRGARNIDLTTVQSISPRRQIVQRYVPANADDGEPTVDVPVTFDDLRRYDVVITGRALERLMDGPSIDRLAEHVAADNGLIMLGEPMTGYTAAPPAVVDASLSIDFGRIGAGRVAKINDAQAWRSIFTTDSTSGSAAATLRAVVRWAAIGDAAPPRVEPDAAVAIDEMTDTTPRPDWLERLAAASGGQVLADDPQPLRDALAAAADPPIPLGETQPAWPRGWVFALIVVPLIAEWFIRRTGGLP